MASAPPGPSSPGPLAAAADFGGERREAFLLPGEAGHYVGATLHWPAAARSGTAKSVAGERETPSAAAGREGASAVLLLPGWSGPRTGPAELLVFLARRLTAAGHLVLRLDFHGRGDSSGAFADCDLDRMIREAELGLEFLRQRAPGAAVTAGGICSGGNVALGLAALRPADVRAVVALSALPFQPARTGAFERRRRWRNVKQYAAKLLSPATWARLARGEVNVGRVRETITGAEKKSSGERNLKDSARDIEKDLCAWKGRALFVWGGGDEEAPLARAHFEKLHAAGCGATARFDTLAGANHNFYNQVWREELAARIGGFLDYSPQENAENAWNRQ